MHCFICAQDFNIGYWDGQKCTEQIKNTNCKISHILTQMLGSDFEIVINEEDMICATCLILLEDFYGFQRKGSILRQLVLRQVSRTYNLAEQFENIAIDEKALRTFYKNQYEEYCCKRCYYKTRFLDTVTPHFLFHSRFHSTRHQQPQNQTNSATNQLIENIRRERNIENWDVDDALKAITDIVDTFQCNLNSVNDDTQIAIPRLLRNSDFYKILEMETVKPMQSNQNSSNNDLVHYDKNATATEKTDNIPVDVDVVHHLDSTDTENGEMHIEHETEEIEKQICSSEETTHCKFCDQYFSNTDAANKHMEIFHLCCAECKKIFGNKIKLKKHLHSVHRGEIYKCDLCSNSYRSRDGLIKHLRHHIKSPPLNCEKCGKGFWDKVPFAEHVNQHINDSNYICSKCGQTFNRSSTLRLHLKYHETPTPFKCKQCSKSYASQSSLAIHRRCIHTGEKPFTCEYCRQSFSTLSSYKIHLISHTNIYPHKCSVCEKGFVRRRDYTNHMVKIHGDNLIESDQQCHPFKISLRKTQNAAHE